MAPPTTLTICVYGSSSERTPQRYLDVAHELGRLLGEGGHLCINGAGKHGCMGALNDGVEHMGGHVRGVIHAKWVVDKHEHPFIRDLIIVEGDDLQERKKALVHGVDCIIALPGGPGTWDEMWEMACQRGCGFSGVPIVAINVDGFYDGFVTQLQRAHADGLLYLPPQELLHFERDAESALRWCVETVAKHRAGNIVIPIKVERKEERRGSLNFRVGDVSVDENGQEPAWNSPRALVRSVALFAAGAAAATAVAAAAAVRRGR